MTVYSQFSAAFIVLDNYSVELTSLDPFGQVSQAFLRLKGDLLSVQAQKSPERTS
jgi:hypothetical protein